MRRFLVLDFVGNYLGTTSASLARRVIAQAGVPHSQTILVSRPDQAALSQELLGISGVETVETPDAKCEKFRQIPTVLRIIQRMLPLLAPGETILVVSYSGPALSQAKRTSPARIETESFRNYYSASDVGSGVSPGHGIPNRSGSALEILQPPMQSMSWAFGWICALDEAISSMVSALARAGYNSIHNALADPHLRPLIGDTDPRFRGRGVMTGTQGMMSQLISAAHSRGLIEVARNSKGTRFIWVRAATTHAATSGMALPDSAKPASLMDKGGALPADADVAGWATAPPPNDRGSDLSQQEEAKAATPQSGTLMEKVSTTTTPPVKMPMERYDNYRSGRLQTALHDAGFGPYSEPRMHMNAIIEQLVKQTPGNPLSHVIRDAKKGASAAGKTDKKGNPYNYRKIGLFVEDLLTATDACLGQDDKPIGRGIVAATSAVHKLSDSWQQKADAEIILRLVDLVNDVGHDDHENLAGILYLKRDEEACDRIEVILRYLVVESRKLEEVEVKGRLVYRRPPSPSALRVAQ